MTMPLSELQIKIHRLLDDPDENKYEEDMINDGIHAGLDAIMPWAPMLSTVELLYTSGSSTNTLFDLPDDLYDIEAVYSLSGIPIQPALLSPTTFRGDSVSVNDWLLFPTNKIKFSLSLTENVTIYYLAYWPKITDTDSNVGVPSHLIGALSFYAAAYCLIPEGVSSAEIRQWATKVDSGNPEHNPVAIRVTELLKLFDIEIRRHKPYVRSPRI